MINIKIVLTGNFGVGKTSLFQRFISDEFSNDYKSTVGVHVEKKEVAVNDKSINMLVWDLAEKVNQKLIPNSYFMGAAGIILVVDLSQPKTFEQTLNDYNHIKKVQPGAIVKVVGNKKDLFIEEEIEKIKESIPIPINSITSAKTGENVENLFLDLAYEILDSAYV